MKALILISVLMGSSAYAQNALIRVCNVTQGVFHEMKTAEDQVGFCQYGTALMDSLSILEATSDQVQSSAVLALQSSLSCEQAHGNSVKVQDLDGKPFQICEFEDGSSVELQTLAAGPLAESNAGLMKALNTRF